MKTINECFENQLTEGIFYYINMLNPPWEGSTNDADLNLLYHFSHSGEKWASRFLINLCDSETGYISQENGEQLASSLLHLYEYKWTRIYNTLLLEYDPISNYDMTEHETGRDTDVGTHNISGTFTNTDTITNGGTDITIVNIKDSKTGHDNTDTTGSDKNTKGGKDTITVLGSDKNTKSGIDTVTNNGTETTLPGSITTDDGNTYTSVYGFNSEETVGQNIVSPGNTRTMSGRDFKSSTNTNTTNWGGINTEIINNENTTEYGATDTITYGKHDRTDYFIDNTQKGSTATGYGKSTTDLQNGTNSNTDSHNITKTIDRSLTRSGNIGVTTTQQMIESEREVAMFNFFETVFADIDKYLALKIY